MDATTPERPEPRDHLRQAKFDEIGLLEASPRDLKSHHNELAPISRLPFDVLATIFFLLSVFVWNEGSGILTWVCVAHVCRRWRETALNYPRFWSHINFTTLTPVGMVEILSRAKMAPLHLKADGYNWNTEQYEVFIKQLGVHTSHTRHLTFCGYHLSTVVERLISPTSTLESLTLFSSFSMFHRSYAIISDNIFNCTAPSLTTLHLERCNIGWKSPLLKGLRTLKILGLSEKARPQLDDWLDALDEMPQLEELSLQSATPVASLDDPVALISRTVTLPSLIYFHIDALAEDCAFALAHLVLPTLTRLYVQAESWDPEGEDVLLVIPYVVRNVNVLHDIEPIRSILIAGERKYTEFLTWTTLGADVEVCGPDSLIDSDVSLSACLQFAADGNKWKYGVDTAICDALLTLLPINSLSTLTAHNHTRLSKESWLRHAARLPLLEQARLVPYAVSAFMELLSEAIPLDSDGPRLPKLKKLILLDVRLTALRTSYLRETLIKRVEQGVPLECLDLRTCIAVNCPIQLLTEIGIDVREPPGAPKTPLEPEVYIWYTGFGYDNGIGFDDGQRSWYDDAAMDKDEDGNEDDSENEGEGEGDGDGGDENGDEDDGEDENEMDYEVG